jgi:hypothetical protein
MILSILLILSDVFASDISRPSALASATPVIYDYVQCRGDFMIRYKPLPPDIDRRLTRAGEYLEAHPRVVFAYLFGGLTRHGSRQPMSDVDIAVYLVSPRYVARTKLAILGRLSAILGTEEIDLVILNTSPPTLTMNVLRHKRLLTDKDPSRRHAFESLAFRKYFDFQPFERRLLEKRVQHGG